ncbi:short-chain dehydrogenase [Mycobacteroides chelonae CCUG 47445]|nr:short-chain dehydrogenase [Mycobacteroides chelonae CCUG 47445]
MGRSRPSLVGQVVAITGAGHGIGAEVAQELVAGGARVALIDRDTDAVRRLAVRLGDQAAAFEGDVTSDASICDAMICAAAHFGRLDAVVANAGIAGHAAPVAGTQPEQFEQVIQVNLLGVYRTVHGALPHLAPRDGYILIVSSIASVIPGPTISAYVASKAGVEAFARALRIELYHKRIDVGLAYFGLVDTDLAQKLTSTGLGAVMATFPKILAKPIPVSRAAAAIVRGIQGRARRVYAPWWVPALLDLRPLVILADRAIQRHPALTAMISAQTAPTGTATAPLNEKKSDDATPQQCS